MCAHAREREIQPNYNAQQTAINERKKTDNQANKPKGETAATYREFDVLVHLVVALSSSSSSCSASGAVIGCHSLIIIFIIYCALLLLLQYFICFFFCTVPLLVASLNRWSVLQGWF